MDTASKDWTAVNQMFKAKLYVYALFFTHLVLEKLIKAHWVKDNEGNYPPRIHNLVRLVEETNLEFSEIEMSFLRRINDFQLEGRYPDYKQSMYSFYKAKNTKPILDSANKIRKWLLKKLQ